MHLKSFQAPPRSYRTAHLTFMAVVMAAIFLADTTTRYEVAVSVFYAGVILTAVRVLSRRAVVALTGLCIAMTLLSFGITPHGDYGAGLINLSISIVSILITSYLVLRMEAARSAAHDAQAQLLRIARVKTLEGLTTSIAHEINQPLAAIVTSGNACRRWLAHEPANLEKARQALERILADAGRLDSIVARVRSLTKGEPPCRTAFEFNAAVEEVVAISQGEIARGGIALTVDLSPDLPCALADRIQIQQVMSNLILNAIEATLPMPLSKRTIRIASVCRDDEIVFTVSDSGVGLPAGSDERLFEAFWTTKKTGIGVGLSISRAIVEANGGHIHGVSNAPDGAVFTFSVSATDKEHT
ncbi:MAG: GHKL domain-containing protein [Burkholderiaceae bacterium]|jgi:signal transduction histidine kinase|nr:GHKL domain-containing protein [Burkholderiaceae bacterium]